MLPDRAPRKLPEPRCAVYGILVGVGFLASPVVQSLGVGLFGVDFGWRFAATVLTAHAAFGFALSLLLRLRESCLCRD